MKIDFTIKRKILRIDGSRRELIFEIAALYFLEFQVSHAQRCLYIVFQNMQKKNRIILSLSEKIISDYKLQCTNCLILQ